MSPKRNNWLLAIFFLGEIVAHAFLGYIDTWAWVCGVLLAVCVTARYRESQKES